MSDRSGRYRGCLLGLAAGDALGTTIEFSPPGTFEPVETITGGGPFALNPGEWTDDTSMALCLAESLIECDGFDPTDQMKRYVQWAHSGHLSSNGRCFDIGNTVRIALRSFLEDGQPYAGSTSLRSAGNGSIMRLAPVPMAYGENPAEALRLAAESSRTTHGAETCLDACRYLGGLLVGALRGEEKSTLLAPRYSPVPGYLDEAPLVEEIDEIAAGSFREREPPDIVGSGWVVRSLEAALWAFSRSESFREGALLAVNLGNDADTTGAVYGQLAGAHYGVEGIPAEWRELLAFREDLESFADRLLEMSGRTAVGSEP